MLIYRLFTFFCVGFFGGSLLKFGVYDRTQDPEWIEYGSLAIAILTIKPYVSTLLLWDHYPIKLILIWLCFGFGTLSILYFLMQDHEDEDKTVERAKRILQASWFIVTSLLVCATFEYLLTD